MASDFHLYNKCCNLVKRLAQWAVELTHKCKDSYCQPRSKGLECEAEES